MAYFRLPCVYWHVVFVCLVFGILGVHYTQSSEYFEERKSGKNDDGPRRGDQGTRGDNRSRDRTCKTGWMPMLGTCYLFVSQPPTEWTEAKQACEQEGAQLMSFLTIPEIYKVGKKMREIDRRRTWWIGLFRNNSESSWQWLDRNALSYRDTPWMSGEPNNDGKAENCAEMNSNGRINDKECEALRPFICKIVSEDPDPEDIFPEDGNERMGPADRGKGKGKKTGDRNDSSDDEDDEDEDMASCYVKGSRRRGKERGMLSPYSGNSSVCPPVVAKRTKWPETLHGVTQRRSCQRGNGTMTFYCGGNPTCWRGEPNTDQCASRAFKNLLERFSSDDALQEVPEPEETLAITSELANVTKGDDVTEADIAVTSKLIRAVRVAARKVKDKRKVRRIVANVIKAGSNLVSRNKSAVWAEMDRRDKVRSATSLLLAMESASVAMAGGLGEPTTIVTRDDNIELELRVVNVSSPSGQQKEDVVYSAEDSDTQFSIPLLTLTNLSSGGLAKMVFMTHYTMGSLLGDNDSDNDDKDDDNLVEENNNNHVKDDDKTAADKEEAKGEVTPAGKLASYVVTASVATSGEKGGSSGMTRKLPQPVTFTISHTKKIPEGFEPLCTFWSISENGLGVWSQEGCRKVEGNESHTQCQCDHMTNFAVLMAVKDVQISEAHKKSLQVVTIIGCVLSCIFLALSWITFTCFPSLQGERNSIHKNLVFTLFIAELLFLIGIHQTANRVACGIVAGFLHYFFLATFLWMVMEGVHIILMLVQVFDASRSRLPYYYVSAYCPPLLIIAVSAGVYADGYGTESYCWLTTERGFIWSFAGPVAVILFVNSVVLIYAMTMVCRHSDYVFSCKDKNSAGNVRSWIQGAMALEVLLGLTWILGFFFLNEQSVAVAYVFTILNSTQGIFIFVFHCVLNKKARKEYRRAIKLRRQPSSTGTGTGTHSASLARNKLTNTPSFNTHNQPSSQDTSRTFV